MQNQYQQMKSSIANIQHHLRKLEEHQQTIKFDQECPNLLPESILHQHTYQKPQPSPKVTETYPNIIKTEIYKPKRHHLDDSQMQKKIIRQEPLSAHRQTKKKHRSLHSKTSFIYDGTKVIYIPPPQQQKEYKHRKTGDYGHIIIQKNKKKENKKRKDEIQKQRQKCEYYQDFDEYGTMKKQIKSKNNKLIDFRQTRNKSRHKRNFRQSQYNDLEFKQLKSTRIQCNFDHGKIKRRKGKRNYKINWASDTDSDFSELDINAILNKKAT